MTFISPVCYSKHLPCLRQYVAGWKALNALPDETKVTVPGFIVGMPGWPRQTSTAGAVKASMTSAMMNRINRRGDLAVREPRETEISLWRDSRRVRDILTTRLRVYQFETKAARSRFSHLLARSDD